MEYRIREAVVEVCNGYTSWRDRRFIAERRISFLGLLSWWFPVIDGEWRASKEAARRDVERDINLREPLAPPEFIDTP